MNEMKYLERAAAGTAEVSSTWLARDVDHYGFVPATCKAR